MLRTVYKISLGLMWLLLFGWLYGFTAHYSREGETVRVYCSDFDLSSVVARLNAVIELRGVRFVLVDTQAEADLRVILAEPIAGAYADSAPVSGLIRIQPNTPDEHLPYILLHEALHCAGSDHDEANEGTVMHPGPLARGIITAEQVRDLMRLDGITAPERFVAALRQLF